MPTRRSYPMRKNGTIVVAAMLAAFLGTVSNAADTNTAAALAEFRAAAQLTPDRLHGAALFETCAACHGTNGRGTSDGAVPAIAGQHGSVILKQLVDFRHDRRWNERMAHFADRHHLPTAQDLTDVAAYASSLPRFPATTEGIGDGTAL